MAGEGGPRPTCEWPGGPPSGVTIVNLLGPREWPNMAISNMTELIGSKFVQPQYATGPITTGGRCIICVVSRPPGLCSLARSNEAQNFPKRIDIQSGKVESELYVDIHGNHILYAWNKDPVAWPVMSR